MIKALGHLVSKDENSVKTQLCPKRQHALQILLTNNRIFLYFK